MTPTDPAAATVSAQEMAPESEAEAVAESVPAKAVALAAAYLTPVPAVTEIPPAFTAQPRSSPTKLKRRNIKGLFISPPSWVRTVAPRTSTCPRDSASASTKTLSPRFAPGVLSPPLAQMEGPQRFEQPSKSFSTSTSFSPLTRHRFSARHRFLSDVYLNDHFAPAPLPFCYDEHHENENVRHAFSAFCDVDPGVASLAPNRRD